MSLEIGQVVEVAALTSLGYDEEGNRVAFVEQLITPTRMIVIGGIQRPLGKYHKGSSYATWDGEEFEPPYLEVTSKVKLVQLRSTFFSKPVEAQYPHVTILSEHAPTLPSSR